MIAEQREHDYQNEPHMWEVPPAEPVTSVEFGGGWKLAFNEVGRLTVLNKTGEAVLKDASAGIQFKRGDTFSIHDAAHREIITDGDRVIVKAANADGSLTLEWQITTEPDNPSLTFALQGSGTEGRYLERMNVLTVEDGFRGEDPKNLMLDTPGTHAWDTDFVCQLDEIHNVAPYATDVFVFPAHETGVAIPVAAQLTTEDGASAFFGFVTAHAQYGLVELGVTPDHHAVQAWVDCRHTEPRFDEASGRYMYDSPEKMWVTFDKGKWEAIDERVRRLKSEMGVSQELHEDEHEYGVNEWYNKKQTITIDDLKRNIAVVTQNPQIFPFTRFEVDDGAQVGKHIGNVTLDPTFADLPDVIKKAREGGYNFLKWECPFWVNSNSEIYKRIMDEGLNWLVHDINGDPISVEFEEWAGTTHLLDIGREDVREYLRSIIRTIKSFGFDQKGDVIKLDFLYGGMAAGLENFRKALTGMVDEAGDVGIMFCGAPFDPCVGIANKRAYMRISPDTNRTWHHKDGPHPRNPSVENNTKYARRRTWLHPLFKLDHDNFVLPDKDHPMSRDELLYNAVSNIMVGPQIITYSADYEYGPEALDLAGWMLPKIGAPGKPVDRYADKMIKKTPLDSSATAIFNSSDGERNGDLNLSEFGLPAGEHHVYDLLSHRWLGKVTDGLRFPPQPPRNVRYFSVRTVEKYAGQEIPQVVGTTINASGDGEIKQVKYHKKEDALALTVGYPDGFRGIRDGVASVYVPDGRRLVTADGAELIGQDGNIAKVLLKNVSNIDQQVALHFSC